MSSLYTVPGEYSAEEKQPDPHILWYYVVVAEKKKKKVTEIITTHFYNLKAELKKTKL